MPCVHIITTPKLLLFFLSPPPIFFPPFFSKIFFPPHLGTVEEALLLKEGRWLSGRGVAMSDALSKAALFWVAAAALQRSRGLQEIRL